MSDYHDQPIESPQPLQTAEWYVKRHAEVREVTVGESIRFKVIVWDEGREPFVTKWFNDPTPALDLMENIRNENERHHNIRIQEVE